MSSKVKSYLCAALGFLCMILGGSAGGYVNGGAGFIMSILIGMAMGTCIGMLFFVAAGVYDIDTWYEPGGCRYTDWEK